MPVITEIELQDVPIGPAVNFRQTINTNFDNIKTEFGEVYDTMTTQPTTQKTGDFWFKDLGSST